jgi:hypothetical protein
MNPPCPDAYKLSTGDGVLMRGGPKGSVGPQEGRRAPDGRTRGTLGGKWLARAAGLVSPFPGTFTENGPEPVSKDRPFDPWRAPRGHKAQAIVDEVLVQVEHFEKVKALRKRRRRPTAQDVFKNIISALVCEAMHRELSSAGGLVSVALSKDRAGIGRKGRYGSPVLSETLPHVLQRMAAPEMAWLTFKKGERGYTGISNSRLSTFGIGARLLTRMRAHGITLGDLARRPGEEVIVLKRGKESFWDKGARIDYQDTPETERQRADLRKINAWLEDADIWFDDGGAPTPVVDTGDRRLYRVFNNGRFNHGGRLFGGFWPQMRRERRSGIMFGEESSEELDYGQTSLRILYGIAGVAPPEDDLYSVPGLEKHREGVKKLFNALLFDRAPRVRYPKGLAKLFPPSWQLKAADAIEAILSHHASVRRLIEEPEVGFRVMAIESRVMMSVLLRMREAGLQVALPIHDAVLIPAADRGLAKGIMQESFKEVTGVSAQVRTKGEVVEVLHLACPYEALSSP